MARNAAHTALPADIAGPRIAVLLLVLALTLIGFVMIYSASTVSAITESSDPTAYLVDQLRFAAVGIVAGALLWKVVPYRVWASPVVYLVWVVAAVMLVLTFALGTVGNGAQRWLFIGPVSLQSSEFVKIALVLVAAKVFADFREGALDVTRFAIMLFVLLALPVGFLYKAQSDLGTTAIIVLGIIAVAWLGEAPWKAVAALVLGGAVLAAAATFLVSYRSDRMLYLNPWDDGEGGYGRGYQIIHSYYAFSQGGLFGVGLGNSREKFLYLPESETDFIFSIIGEEFGMVGALVVIGLFMALLYCGMRIARSAPDDFGTMVAGSLTVMIVFQAFLNIGCAMGVFPTTGKPLPFISSGGSSLVASFMMIGLVLAVSEASGEDREYERRRDDLRIVRATDEPADERRARVSLRPRAAQGSTGALHRSFAQAAAPLAANRRRR